MADDDQDFRDSLERALRFEGYLVELACDGPGYGHCCAAPPRRNRETGTWPESANWRWTAVPGRSPGRIAFHRARIATVHPGQDTPNLIDDTAVTRVSKAA